MIPTRWLRHILIITHEIFGCNPCPYNEREGKDRATLKCVLFCLSERLRKTDDLLEDASFLIVSARLAKKLIELGREFGVKDKDVVRIGLRLTQQDMADLVGTTRESINKELRILRERGLVSTEGDYIQLLDLERLKRRIH